MTMPSVETLYCSSSQTVFVVRRRPQVVVNGGGFVVTDCTQKAVFRVDGSEFLGRKEQLILRDGDGDALLLIHPKRGLGEALSKYRNWIAYSETDCQRLVFNLKVAKPCLIGNNAARICTKFRLSSKDCEFDIVGYFPDRECSIIDSNGDIIAQIGVSPEEEDEVVVMGSKDVYQVVVEPGIDQVFVFGVIAVLNHVC